ncbi:MAG: OmpH family outer membrane protein [Pyrinomonadaceae bacterium]
MKLLKSILITFFISITAISVQAQVPAAKTPTKVAVIQTAAFGEEKGGITRYLNVIKRLKSEFKPRKDELDVMQVQLKKLADEINKGGTTGKFEQAETLERDIKRKSDDAQLAYQKRQRELTDPISQDIQLAISAFAKARGIDMLLDISNSAAPVAYVNEAIDITQAFIAEYNTRNP